MPTMTQVENPANQQSLTMIGTAVSGFVSNAENSAGAVMLSSNPHYLYLVARLDQSARALAALGLTESDLLDAVSQVRAEYMAETYSPDYLQQLERAWLALQPEGQGE